MKKLITIILFLSLASCSYAEKTNSEKTSQFSELDGAYLSYGDLIWNYLPNVGVYLVDIASHMNDVIIKVTSFEDKENTLCSLFHDAEKTEDDHLISANKMNKLLDSSNKRFANQIEYLSDDPLGKTLFVSRNNDLEEMELSLHTKRKTKSYSALEKECGFK